MKNLAYLNGVLSGDAWCTELALGLRTKDIDFARAFCEALEYTCQVETKPKRDERSYWLVRISNKTGRFNYLLDFNPNSDVERAMWLKGLFDSDGNAQLTPQPQLSPNSFSRRVAIYSTNINTLERARVYLAELNIKTRLRETKPSKGHKGRKPVFELRLLGGRSNYIRFLKIVGSNIERKLRVLKEIPKSYRPNLSAHCRKAQLKSAKVRHEKTMSETLPKVVEGVRILIQQGIKPTQRNCRSIPGFNSIQRYIRQGELIDLATEKEKNQISP